MKIGELMDEAERVAKVFGLNKQQLEEFQIWVCDMVDNRIDWAKRHFKGEI